MRGIVQAHVSTKTACFGQYLSEFSTKLPQTTTNHDTDHYKWWHESSQMTNHHKPWHKPPWTMTETSTKHDMNHYKSPQTMTWTIMMTQKELCIKPYAFLVYSFQHPFSICFQHALQISTCSEIFNTLSNMKIWNIYSQIVTEPIPKYS